MIIKQGDKINVDKFYIIMEGDCIATKVLEPGTSATIVKYYKCG